jgi:hypothetical protein
MRVITIFIGILLSNISFSQNSTLKGVYLDESLASFYFSSDEIVISDLEFGSGVFYGDYTLLNDTLTITKNPFLAKKNPCDLSVFCDKSKLEPMLFLLKNNGSGIQLEALNVPAELFFESIYKRTTLGQKEEKKYLKRKEVQSASEGSSMAKYYKKIHNRTLLSPKENDQIMTFQSASLRLEGNIKHYFDLEFDSTGYFVARDMYVEKGKGHVTNYYEGSLLEEELLKMNQLYKMSFLSQIKPERLPKRNGNDASLEFSFSIQNQNELKSYKGYGSAVRSYMQSFVEFIQTSFRQTKYQKSDHHYNFVNSMFKE